MLESLDSRRFFSAVLDGDTLKINGTSGADHLKVEDVGDVFPVSIHVQLNSEEFSFDVGAFNRILIDTGGGKDDIDISNVSKRATVLGGNGADRIKINGLSIAVGGAGNDRLVGPKAGPSTLMGGDGDDLLQAQQQFQFELTDPCTMYGGRGNDTLNGGDGADYISGDAGNDELTGGDGDDRILGGAGNDTLAGGDSPGFLIGSPQHHNTLIGNSGNDVFPAAVESVDKIFGGPGRDSVTFPIFE